MQNAVIYIYNGMLYEYHKYSLYKCKYYFYFISSWIKYDADRIKMKTENATICALLLCGLGNVSTFHSQAVAVHKHLFKILQE